MFVDATNAGDVCFALLGFSGVAGGFSTYIYTVEQTANRLFFLFVGAIFWAGVALDLTYLHLGMKSLSVLGAACWTNTVATCLMLSWSLLVGLDYMRVPTWLRRKR